MKKRKILYFILWYVLFCICFLLVGEERLNNGLIILFVPSLITAIIVFVVCKINVKKEQIKNDKLQKVKSISEKYKRVLDLNEKYTFNVINSIDRTIHEKEYSHKGYDRARADSIILYQIENNNDNIREFIIKAYQNKKIYDNYIDDYKKINVQLSDEAIHNIGLTKEEFLMLEEEAIKSIAISKKIYSISVNVIVSYQTPSGYTKLKKNRIVPFDELCRIYMKWKNEKKYAETSKRERRYMTDQLRYDVLKRDNFTCQKCGATAKDGAKLHVDHIIPVYKGGKTTLSNLQTLCDRCNIGKGTKDN